MRCEKLSRCPWPLYSEAMGQPFEISFTAQPDDIDIMGHVNNAVWVRWMEEIATAHWMSLAQADDIARYVWVVTRHEIDYKGNVGLRRDGDRADLRARSAARRPLRPAGRFLRRGWEAQGVGTDKLGHDRHCERAAGAHPG